MSNRPNYHNSNLDNMSSKEIGKSVKRYDREHTASRKDGMFGAIVLALMCLFAAYLMPAIGSYFVIAAVIFALISWALS